jgi:pantoate--beta-alanine ligase
MILFKSAEELHHYLQNKKNKGASIGFVPTMGALHDGHISLITSCKLKSDISVCSIFVNPTQFNDKKDFEKYPIIIEQDIVMLEKAGCDILFLPSIHEIYPNTSDKEKKYDLGFIETVFEGAHRPGHFNGVCMVVERLLNIVEPHQLFLGQKDYQQCIVIKKLIELIKANILVNICSTQRESSGLAMSSRNRRLTETQLQQASCIYSTFLHIKKNLTTTNFNQLIDEAKKNLLAHGFEKIDYVSFANAQTLEPVENYDPKTPIVILVAAFIGEVRLIDNMVLT